MALVFLTAVAGAFVAGLDAGKAYNTFPLMGGRVVPAGYLQLQPWYRNFFEHVPTVQFDHRLLGILVVASALALWWASRRMDLPAPARRAAARVGAMALVQVALGITTLLLVVPIPVAALHQAGAVVLLAFALLLRHALGPAGPAPAPAAVRRRGRGRPSGLTEVGATRGDRRP